MTVIDYCDRDDSKKTTKQTESNCSYKGNADDDDVNKDKAESKRPTAPGSI